MKKLFKKPKLINPTIITGGDSLVIANKRISKKILIIFAAAFGIFGGYFIYQSFAATVNLTINGAQTYQTIDGFGTSVNSSRVIDGNGTRLSEAEYNKALDTLIDGGSTIFRVVIDNMDWESTNDNTDPNSFNWTYYNTIYNSQKFQDLWNTMSYLNSKGIKDDLILNFMGPAPPWMTSGTHTLRSGESFENEWVETVVSVAYYARNTKGLEFGLFAPNNEPDWDIIEGVKMDAVTYGRVMNKVALKLKAVGMGDLKMIGPDPARCSESVAGYGAEMRKYEDLMGNPSKNIPSMMDHYTMHVYDAGATLSTSNMTCNAASDIASSSYPNKNFWMSELGRPLEGMLEINQGASAILPWDGFDSMYQHSILNGNPAVSPNDAGSSPALLSLNSSTRTFTPRKEFHHFKQIFKNVPKGSVRIAATESASNELINAFHHQASGRLTLVGQNTSGSSDTIPSSISNVSGLPASFSFDLTYTNNTSNEVSGGKIPVNGGSFSFTAPANSIYTLTYAPPATPPPPTVTCTSVNYYNNAITYTFDKAYPCGQFANGDWWVAPNAGDSGVRITSISPAFSSGQNGWEVNPIYNGGQGFDSDVGGYSASLVPALPYSAQPNQSIVKATTASGGCANNVGCLQTAAVLTVLGSSPPDGSGVGYLRPPYVGTAKPLIPVSQLRTNLLPSLVPPSGYTPPSISSVSNSISKLQLDHKGFLPNRNLHPIDNMPDYGSDIAANINSATGRLMFNDSIANKMPLLIHAVQGGLDRYYMVPLGQTWIDGGAGHNMGRKLSVAFAALMINDPTMLNNIKTQPAYNNFHEDIGIRMGKNSVALFGGFEYDRGEAAYWNYLATGGNSSEDPDPYGWIDGGTRSGELNSYQFCCTSQPWKGSAMILHLIPELQNIWQSQATLRNYVDRWVTKGAHYQPDPCAPVSQGGGPLPGNESPADCIKDPDLVSPTGTACQDGKSCGRYPNLHGSSADGGYYQSEVINQLWKGYRGSVTPPSGDTTKPTVSISAPAGGTTVSGTTNITANASDNVGVTMVDFLVDGTKVGSDSTSPFSFPWNTTTATNGSRVLTAVAYDAASNNTTSAGVTVTVNNTTTPPPPAPTGTQLLGVQSPIQSNTDTNSSGNAEAFPYTATTAGSAGNISMYLATGTTATSIKVGLYSDSGNDSPGTLLASGTITAGATKDTWYSAALSPSPQVSSGTKYWIAWLGTNGSVSYRDIGSGCSAGTTSEAPTPNSGLTNLPGTWTTGNEWGSCNANAYVTSSGPADTTPPAFPTGASLTATPVSPTQINMSWPAANDNVGITGYDIFSGTTVIAQVSSSTTSYNHTNLSASTTYNYTVKAKDAAGNTTSLTKSATTPAPPTDATPPTAFTLSQGSVTASQVNLSWTLSTDPESGIKEYRVFRNNTQVGTVLSTASTCTTAVCTYGETSGISPSTTYSYYVQAVNGKTTPLTVNSNTLSVTTVAGSTVLQPIGPAKGLGVYAGAASSPDPGNGPPGVANFEQWLGKKIPGAVDFYADGSWSDLKTNKSWQLTPWANTSYKTTFTIAMLPKDGTSNLAAGAAGQYNSHWTTIAQNLIDTGHGSTILRIGHEFNGTWYPWSVNNATDAANFAAYHRQIINTIRAVPGANFKFDWNVNNGNNSNAQYISAAYPGDAYVDIIGIDVYNQSWLPNYQTLTPQERWNETNSTNFGIQYWINFANSHSKPISFPEWGTIIRNDGHGAGDDPYFIQQMYNVITSNNVIYHNYWDYGKIAQGICDIDVCGKISLSNTSFPNASAKYKELFAPLLPVSTSDTTPPAVPASLSATVTHPTATVTTGTVKLDWPAVGDNDLRGYYVYRDNVLISGTDPITAITYTNTTVPSGTYSYTVRSVDTTGNASAPRATNPTTTTVNPIPGDTTPPTAPTNATVSSVDTNADGTPDQINLTWTKSTSTDTTIYNVYRNGGTTPITPTVQHSSCTTTCSWGQSSVPVGTYTYTIEAQDGAGNKSNPKASTTPASITLASAPPPATGCSVTVNSNAAIQAEAAKASNEGKVVCVAAGTYTGTALQNITHPANNKVTIRSENPRQTVLRGLLIQKASGLRIENFKVQGGTITNNAGDHRDNPVSDVDFVGNDIGGGGYTNTAFNLFCAITNVTIENNYIHDINDQTGDNGWSGYGIRLNADPAGAGCDWRRNIKIRYNTFERTHTDAMDIGATDGGEIVGNIIRDINAGPEDPSEHTDSLMFWAGSKNFTIKDNRYSDSHDMWLVCSASGLTVENNLIVRGGQWGINANGCGSSPNGIKNSSFKNNTIWGTGSNWNDQCNPTGLGRTGAADDTNCMGFVLGGVLAESNNNLVSYNIFDSLAGGCTFISSANYNAIASNSQRCSSTDLSIIPTFANKTDYMPTNFGNAADGKPIGYRIAPAGHNWSTSPPPTPGDTTPPTVSINSPITGCNTATPPVCSGTITATATASDNVGVTKVDFYLNNTAATGTPNISDTTSPYNYSLNTLTLTNGNHTITAKAYDAAGNTTATTITFTVSNVDTLAPNPPTSLSGTITQPTSTTPTGTVNLTWPAATDNGNPASGIKGYYVYLGTSVITCQGQTSGQPHVATSCNLPNLQPGSYNYTVRSVDNVNLTSTTSSPNFTATINQPPTPPPAPDTTPPTAPNLTLSVVSATQINLSWTASTDASGIKGYNLYRYTQDPVTNPTATATKLNTSLLPNTTLSYGDTALSPSTTYYYQVEAIDNSTNANTSKSTPRSATTQAAPPPPPTTKPGDITGPSGTPDGVVGIEDVSYMIRAIQTYNSTGTVDPKADFTGPSGTPDNKVTIEDISFVIRNYGK